MTDLQLPIFIFAVLCAILWRNYRKKQGKKVSWYTDVLIAGGLAFAANFIISFGETVYPSFERSFIEGYKRSSGGTYPGVGTIHSAFAAVIAVFVLILAVLLTVLFFGLR